MTLACFAFESNPVVCSAASTYLLADVKAFLTTGSYDKFVELNFPPLLLPLARAYFNLRFFFASGYGCNPLKLPRIYEPFGEKAAVLLKNWWFCSKV